MRKGVGPQWRFYNSHRNLLKKIGKNLFSKRNWPKAVTYVKLPLSSVVCQNFDPFGIRQGKYENRFFHRKM